jgi:tetratricopeptide (TPR) repeat protein
VRPTLRQGRRPVTETRSNPVADTFRDAVSVPSDLSHPVPEVTLTQTRTPAAAFTALPDPGTATGLDDLIDRLRLLKIWAGNPSNATITDRVNAAWAQAGRPPGDRVARNTVTDCFRSDRRRPNPDLIAAIVQALQPDEGYVTQWRQALRVVTGRAEAAAQVRVQDRLPDDLTGFAGRAAEVAALLTAGGRPRAVVGMAGIGKTQLAVHVGHRLAGAADRVLFVNLRGFHPDPAQPPADPAAVLDGFLRLLGVSGQLVPHGLGARSAAYRDRLAGTRTLIVLDNAADADQVRPLLPGTPHCPVLITSRHDLDGLGAVDRLRLAPLTTADAVALLTAAAPGIPTGDDPDAPARIARRCGRLPLALGLVAAHLRDRAGWTLTDHADRLDERHRDRRLDAGVHLALDVSYHHLPADLRRLLRLTALHPGQDFDVYAVAALTGTGLAGAEAGLQDLAAHHLLQQAAPGRFTLHDLVRAYASVRADDEDPPARRDEARTRLFDYYLAAAADAMDRLHPHEAHRRPRIRRPSTPFPALTGETAAHDWLRTERTTLVTIAAADRPAHTVRLAAVLFRYLIGEHLTDTLTVHQHALRAARRLGDTAAQAQALTGIGVAHLRQGRYDPAAEHLEQVLRLHRRSGDRAGEVFALNCLGETEARAGRYPRAEQHLRRALVLTRWLRSRTDEANVLDSLGFLMVAWARPASADARYRQALAAFRAIGDRSGEACAHIGLGRIALPAGRATEALVHYDAALRLAGDVGDRYRVALAHAGLGRAHRQLGHPADARRHHRRALRLRTELGLPDADRIRP